MKLTENDRALFIKFLTPRLTHELDNPLDDWLNWLNPTKHQACYLNSQIKPRVQNFVHKGLKEFS